MIINVQGHREKLVKDLRRVAAEVEQGNFAFIACNDEGNPENVDEIQFNIDDGAFGLEDKPLAEVESDD